VVVALQVHLRGLAAFLEVAVAAVKVALAVALAVSVALSSNGLPHKEQT
jgi:hypothetical protein